MDRSFILLFLCLLIGCGNHGSPAAPEHGPRNDGGREAPKPIAYIGEGTGDSGGRLPITGIRFTRSSTLASADQVAFVANADFDRNGAVDADDFRLLLDAMGSASTYERTGLSFDLDGDGIVGQSDLVLFSAHCAGYEVYASLEFQLKNPQTSVDARRTAIEVLSGLGTAQAVDLMIMALKEDPDSDVRHAAAKGLGEMDEHPVVPALTLALKDSERDVRAAAALALVKTGATQIHVFPGYLSLLVEDLVEMLFVDETVKRYQVLRALEVLRFETVLARPGFDRAMRRYTGLDGDVFRQNAGWRSSYFDLGMWIDLYRLTVLYDAWGPGAARKLYEEYNISCFGRYAHETLGYLYRNTYRMASDGRVFSGRLGERPLAVVAFAKWDPGGSLLVNSSMAQELLDAGYDVRVIESENEDVFAANIQRLSDHYGKISLLVIVGHGVAIRIRFKRVPADVGTAPPEQGIAPAIKEVSEEYYIDLTDATLLSEYIRPYLSENPDVAIVSCLTGYEGPYEDKWHSYYVDESIARYLSRMLEARVFASDGLTIAQTFLIGYDGGTPVLEDVIYQTGKTVVFERGVRVR